jgi:hypothetical protein
MPDINLSPYTAESAAIARKMRLAEALQQQALSPLEMPTMAGVPISPYAGLAKMLQAYSASRMRGKAEEREKTLADTARADTSADFGALLKGLTPTAAVPEGPSTFTANVDQRDIAENPRMVMQPERNEMNEIIQPGEAGAGNFGVTPGTPAIPATTGELTAEGFKAMKTPAGQQQYMAQLLAQIAPKDAMVVPEGGSLYSKSGKLLVQGAGKNKFGNIDPSKFTPDSLALFMASGGKDFSLLRTPPPNLSFQNTGGGIQAFDPRLGTPVGTATPITVSPNTKATLDQARILSDRAFNNLSANQRLQLENEAARLNISAQQLFFDTGLQAGGGARLPPPVTPSAAAPSGAPAVPAAMPAALAGAQPVVARPAAVAPVAARPAAAAPVTAAPVVPPAAPDAQAALSPRARQELEKTRQLEEFKGMTEVQSNAALFGGAMKQAQNVITQLESQGTVKNAIIPSVLQSVVKLIPFGPGEQAASMIESIARTDPTSLFGPDQNQQRLGQAQIAFATAWLRKTSGAAFGGSEIANTIKEYFPLIGEGEAVIKQKAEARDRAIEGLRLSTGAQGKAYIDKYGGSPTGGASNDPLGLRKK